MSAAYILNSVLASAVLYLLYIVYVNFIKVRWNPLHQIAGPPVSGWFKNHLYAVLEYVKRNSHRVVLILRFRPSVSPKAHETYIQKYGRSFRIRGVGPVCSAYHFTRATLNALLSVG